MHTNVMQSYTASFGIIEKGKARNNPEMEGRVRCLRVNIATNWVTCQCRCHAISSQTWIGRLRYVQATLHAACVHCTAHRSMQECMHLRLPTYMYVYIMYMHECIQNNGRRERNSQHGKAARWIPFRKLSE